MPGAMAVTPPRPGVCPVLLVGVEPFYVQARFRWESGFFVGQNSCATGKERLWKHQERIALFAARDNPAIERVQIALAGINAHINHDLPLAMVQTGKGLHLSPDRNSAEYSDFENVNSVLSEVMPGTLNVLATGMLGELVQDTGTIGRLLAMWSVQTARDTAWTNAELLWELQFFRL